MKKIYKLNELCEIKNGSVKYNLKYASKNPGIYPIYSNKKTKIPRCYINSFDFQGEHIFFVCAADKKIIGTTFYVNNEKFSIASGVKILTNFKTNLNIKYLFFFVYQLNINRYALVSTNSIYHIRNLEMYDIDVFLPSLYYQNYFIKKLWFLENSFNRLIKLKTQLQDLKRKLLSYCFNFYLAKEKFYQCKLNKIAEAKVAFLKSSKIYFLKNIIIYPLSFYKSNNDPIFVYIKEYNHSNNFFMFSRYGTHLTNFYYLNYKKFPQYERDTIIYLKNTVNNLNLNYLYFYLLFEQRNIRYLYGVGSLYKKIYLSDLKNYSIQIPSSSIQNKIIDFFNSFEFIDPLILKIDNFLNLYNNNYKKTLLQIIFSLIK